MFTEQTLIIINIASIFFLLVIMVVLIAATRFKGGAGWVALIIVATTVPVYVGNMARDLATDSFLMLYCLSALLNPVCIPSIWVFVRSQLDKSFHCNARCLLHLIPVFISIFTTDRIKI